MVKSRIVLQRCGLVSPLMRRSCSRPPCRGRAACFHTEQGTRNSSCNKEEVRKEGASVQGMSYKTRYARLTRSHHWRLGWAKGIHSRQAQYDNTTTFNSSLQSFGSQTRTHGCNPGFHFNELQAMTGVDSGCNRETQSFANSMIDAFKNISKDCNVTEARDHTPKFVSFRDVGRCWVSMKKQKTGGAGFEFSVLSYNLLADHLLNENMYLYSECADKDFLHWDYRKRNLLKEIISYDADVMCFQEVQNKHYHDWFQPQLQKLGYQSMYKQRSGDKCDGCALFFKSSKFNIVHSHDIEFRRPGVPLMDRDNVAIIAVLEPKSKVSSSPVCITTTHLLFNKNRGDIKLAQLAYLLAEIEKHSDIRRYRGIKDRMPPVRNRKSMPIVLCGDFNSLPFSPLYDLVVKGRLKFEGQSRARISGQNRGTDHPGTVFGQWLLPEQLNISHTCRWKPKELVEVGDDSDFEETSKAGYHSATSAIGIEPHACTSTTKPRHLKHLLEGTDLHLLNERSSAQYHKDSSVSQSLHCDQHQIKPSTSKETVVQCSEANKVTFVDSGDTSINYYGSQKKEQKNIAGKYYDTMEEPGILKHFFSFKSVHKHFHPDATSEITTCHRKASCTVDYFFYGNRLKRKGGCYVDYDHKNLELLGYLSLAKEADLHSMGGLPNRHLSSDHVALLANFSLN